MFGKILFISFLFMTQVSCADPNYASTSGPVSPKALNACQAQFTSGLCVSFVWEQMPTGGAFGSFLFQTFRVDAEKKITTAEDMANTAAVVLWMPDMGHGSSPVTVEKLSTGSYRATNVFFSMSGAWEIRFQSKDGNVVRDQAIIPITL